MYNTSLGGLKTTNKNNKLKQNSEMKKISKINQLVLRGLLAEDQELFLNRLSVIIERGCDEVLKQLADGVVIDATINDGKAALEYLTNCNSRNGWTILEITGISLTNDPDRVSIKYKYSSGVKWFSTQEKADRYSRGYSEDGVKEMNEEHQFKGMYTSSSSDSVSISEKWLTVEIL
jgi:hypothetical protein